MLPICDKHMPTKVHGVHEFTSFSVTSWGVTDPQKLTKDCGMLDTRASDGNTIIAGVHNSPIGLIQFYVYLTVSRPRVTERGIESANVTSKNRTAQLIGESQLTHNNIVSGRNKKELFSCLLFIFKCSLDIIQLKRNTSTIVILKTH